MTCLQFTLRVPGNAPTVLTLPQSLTARALLEFEHAFARTLGVLHRDLLGENSGATPEHAVRRPDAAEIEYASWMPDPGAVEVSSWTAHLRTALR